MKDNIEKKPLGGVIELAVLSLILTLFLSYGSISNIILPFNFNEQWIAISNIELDSYNEGWIKFAIFSLTSNLVIILYAIILLVFFIKQSKYTASALVSFVMLRILLITLVFYFQTVVKGPITPTIDEIIRTVIRALIIPGAWIPYIMLSKRARESFIH